jgi:hypothetical protein
MGLDGRWRIVEGDLCDQDAIDLVGPGFIEFGPNGQGSFRFIIVEAEVEYRRTKRDGGHCNEFSWEGTDEGDPVSGRGRAMLDIESLVGHIYIHMRDESRFRAERS